MALCKSIMYSFYIIKMAQDKSRVNEVLFLHQIRGNFDFLGSLSKFAFCRRVAGGISSQTWWKLSNFVL